jgi:hypothetical protein
MLQQYIGRYEIDPKFAHDFVLYVSVKDGALWVRPSILRPRQLVPASESTKTERLVADEFILTNGREIRAMRVK